MANQHMTHRERATMAVVPIAASFAERIREELDELAAAMDELLADSAIRNIDLNRGPSDGMVFIGFERWGWAPDGTVAARSHLLNRYRDWHERFSLLHPTPLEEVRAKAAEADEHVRRWLERESGDHSVPSTIEKARALLGKQCDVLREMITLATAGPSSLIAVPDTNVLLNDPDVARYSIALGTDDYTVVIVPTVLGELDELKDRGRTPDVRDMATKAIRRIKGYRDRGRLIDGVKVQGRTMVRALHREPDARGVLSWLDPDVPDDRILASALEHQAAWPASTVVLVTGDINLQTKAEAAAGLAPYWPDRNPSDIALERRSFSASAFSNASSMPQSVRMGCDGAFSF